MPRKKITQEEVNHAYSRLHGNSDDFMEMIQLKAGLRLLRDDEEISKERLKYAETIVATRINDILKTMIPGVDKRTRTLRELAEKEIESDLFLRLAREQDYIFHLYIPSEDGKLTEERQISPKDMLYISPVQTPYKWKLSSIEVSDGEQDYLFNCIFGQGVVESGQMIPGGVPSSLFGRPTTAMTNTNTTASPAGIETVASGSVSKVGKFFLYSLWCGHCKDYTHFGLPFNETKVDPVNCGKCSRPLLSPMKSTETR